MNLSKLFEIQRKLDDHIEREHPRQPGEERLAKKILALQVELGELANEWRGFKFWKVNPKPSESTFKSCSDEEAEHYFCEICHRSYSVEKAVDISFQCCSEGDMKPMKHCNPLLEEYVDCLHFILSIGLELGIQQVLLRDIPETKDITYQFLNLYGAIERLSECNRNHTYSEMFSVFIILGKQLGFNWEQIEQAYLEKNKINHERQANGY